jgi:hypothetical protein
VRLETALIVVALTLVSCHSPTVRPQRGEELPPLPIELRGLVVDDSTGLPVPNAIVDLSHGAGSIVWTATDGAGRYVLRAALPRYPTCVLPAVGVIARPTYLRAQAPIRCTSDCQAVDFRLQRSGEPLTLELGPPGTPRACTPADSAARPFGHPVRPDSSRTSTWLPNRRLKLAGAIAGRRIERLRRSRTRSLTRRLAWCTFAPAA